jgi:hypothetical protein
MERHKRQQRKYFMAFEEGQSSFETSGSIKFVSLGVGDTLGSGPMIEKRYYYYYK